MYNIRACLTVLVVILGVLLLEQTQIALDVQQCVHTLGFMFEVAQ